MIEITNVVATMLVAMSNSNLLESRVSPSPSYQSGGILVRVGTCLEIEGPCSPPLECYGSTDTNINGGLHTDANDSSVYGDVNVAIAGTGDMGLSQSTLEIVGDGTSDGRIVKAQSQLENNVVFRASGGSGDDFQITLRAWTRGEIKLIADSNGDAKVTVVVKISADAQQTSGTATTNWDDAGDCSAQQFSVNYNTAGNHDSINLEKTFTFVMDDEDAYEEWFLSLAWPTLTTAITEVLDGEDDTFVKGYDTRLNYILNAAFSCEIGSFQIDPAEDPLTLYLDVELNDAP